MSALACNLQTAGLNDQQELRKAAFKQVYGWSISPALWAQSLTHNFWFQKLFVLYRRRSSFYDPDYRWERRPGCEAYLAAQYGGERCLVLAANTAYMCATLSAITSKSSEATLPTGGLFPPGVFLQPDTKRLKLTPD